MTGTSSAAKVDPAPSLAGLRRTGRGMVLCLIAAGVAAAWCWRGKFDLPTLSALIRSYPAAPLVFLGLHIIASLTFVPRTLLGVVAGAVFGMWWGLLWAALGSVLGATAGFVLVRSVHPGLFDQMKWAGVTRTIERAERGGWRTVAAIRLIPIIPHSLANYAFGLIRLRLAPYALGSLLGQLPLTIVAVAAGAAGERMTRGAADWLIPTLIGMVALVLTMIIPVLLRRKAPAA
jgi:uncharacterized membrane protein YdjX (TVP38/TMEM64 family)